MTHNFGNSIGIDVYSDSNDLVESSIYKWMLSKHHHEFSAPIVGSSSNSTAHLFEILLHTASAYGKSTHRTPLWILQTKTS